MLRAGVPDLGAVRRREERESRSGLGWRQSRMMSMDIRVLSRLNVANRLP